MADIFTKEKRSEIMRKIKNKNTNIELLLRKELFKRGYRYKVKNNLFGKPDFIFTSKKIAVFCDGDFWHGRKYQREKKNYKTFWVEKIKINIARDKKVNTRLRKEGWVVLRFWKTDILRNLAKCSSLIEKTLI